MPDPERAPWLPEGEAPADTFVDMKVDGGKFSVFETEADRPSILRVVAAYAGSRDEPGRLDYLLLHTAVFSELGIATERTGGGTPDDEVNGLHVDAVELTASKAADLVCEMWNTAVERERLAEREVLEALCDSVRRGYIRLEGLKNKVRAWVGGALAVEPGPRP